MLIKVIPSGALFGAKAIALAIKAKRATIWKVFMVYSIFKVCWMRTKRVKAPRENECVRFLLFRYNFYDKRSRPSVQLPGFPG